MKRTPSDKWPRKVKVGSVSVTIYQRRRSDGNFGYEVSDYSSGVRKLRSFSNADAAINDATRIARLMASGESHAATISGKEVASYGRALELLRPTGMALEVVAATYASAFAALGGDFIAKAVEFYKRNNPDNLTQRTVEEAAAEFVALKESRRKSERYIRDLRGRLFKFSDAFRVPIASVTTADIQGWLDGMKASPQSVKNYRTVVGTLFAFAEARNYILKGNNPVKATETVKATNADAVVIFTPGEVAGILAASRPAILPCIALGAFAGLRTAEIQRLDWRDVDLAGGFVTVAADKAKTKSRRLVKISANLAQWLAPYAQAEGKLWSMSAFRYHKLCAEAAEAAGVEWKPNALRHSYASYRLAEVQSAAQVALDMGNSPKVVFEHYRELVKPDAAAAWFAIAPNKEANVIPLSQVA